MVTIAGGATSVTVHVGKSVVLPLIIGRLRLVGAPVTLSCSGLPAGASCAFDSSSLSISQLPATVHATISTTLLTLVGDNHNRETLFAWALLFPCAVLFRGRKLKKHVRLSSLCMMILLALGLVSCGRGIITDAAQSTPPGSYPIVITASSNGVPAGNWNVQLIVTH
jgi:hypothetical protein